MQELGPAPQVLTNEEILAQYGKSLDEVIAAATDSQYEFERTIQINKARRNWQFVKGNQFLVPGLMQSSGGGEIADYLLIDSAGAADEGGADIKFCHPINVLGGDLYKFMAVMGNTAPRVKGVPDDPQDADEIEQAKDADATIRDLWQKWHADQLARVMAFHQYTTGPTYWRTVWRTDRLKYGQSVEPKIEVQQVPQPDGTTAPAPVQTGVNTYENGDTELVPYTILEVSHPYMTKDLSQCAWFTCEVMRSKWDLLSAFKGTEQDPQTGQPKPGPLEKYRGSEPPDDDTQASSNSAQEARESVANPSGLGRAKRPDQWRFREHWFHPNLFEAITDSEARQVFQRQFADGMYLAKANSVKVRIDNRKVTDEWSVCKTGRGEKLIEDPICSDSIPLQRALNDLMNLWIETVLRAIPQTVIDTQLFDRNAMAKKEALPAEIIFTQMPVDGDISKRIAQIPPAHVSDQLAPLAMQLRTYQQDITGIRPELSGGGAPTQTYREAKQRKDQALMQLSPQADEMSYCWERIAENGVRMRARYASGTTKVPRKGSFGPETDVVDNAKLTETGWHAEADDNFPMSNADRFDKMWALLKEFPPEVQQQLSILDPMNLEETLQLLQIPGYESVAEDQKYKTLQDVQQLLAGSPIEAPPPPPGPPGQPPPPPGPPQPSIPMDQYDDHAFVSDFLRKWMVSRTGQKAKQQSPDGFANVQAFQAAHEQAAQPPAPPPPPPLKGAVSFTGKLEDLAPDVVAEVIQGAGLPPPPPPQMAQQSAPIGAPLGASPGSPAGGAPLGPPPAKLDAKESPLPPVPGLEGPPQ